MEAYKAGNSDIHQLITKIMKRRKWWKPWQVQHELNCRRKKRISESTLNRELRRMPNITNRPCHNDSWDYSIAGSK